MELNNQDKTFLMKSMKNVRRVMKIFAYSLTEKEIELINSLEPAIKSNTLDVGQIEFLIKNMENVYKTTPTKYIKKLIGNLNALRDYQLGLKLEVPGEPAVATETEEKYEFNKDSLTTK